jgi:tripartite-type tricarboxylate transporter receptor subunit TctC
VKIDMTTVPYKGTAPAMTDLLGGQVDIMCDQTTNTTSQIASGKVKAYAVTTTKRLTRRRWPPADAGRVRPEGLQRVHLARPVRAQGHAQGRGRKLNTLKNALKDPEFIKRQEGLGAVVVTDAASTRPSTRSSSRPRSPSGARPSRPPGSTPTDP